MPQTFIVRFRVISVECKNLPNGQQFTLYYRRGSTARSTPCYVAQDGRVDFSAMPEGAAVVHFKNGKSMNRFAPKYIQLRLEEYTRGAPRQPVGELEVDCGQGIHNGMNQYAGIVEQNFTVRGMPAKIRIALLVYPDNAAPLSFDGLIDANAGAAAAHSVPKGNVKAMTRGEAMTLLISLEAMLERRGNAGVREPTTRVEKRLRELEERRKQLTGTEGMASSVVRERAEHCVAAQYVALAHKLRGNYVGETAAYLRQMALSSGELLSEDSESDQAALRAQLRQTELRLEELHSQQHKLEQDQLALGRLQHKTDVTQELCANLEKVATVSTQIKTLERQQQALTAAVSKAAMTAAATPLSKEVQDIDARVKALATEQQQLQAKVRHMSGVAVTHVLAWARSKNPPEESLVKRPGTDATSKKDVDDLFREDAGPRDILQEQQRKEIMNAFKDLKASAPPPTARSASSSSSGHASPREMFGSDLPSRGDFSQTKPQQQQQQRHADPLRPEGMSTSMFAPQPSNAGGAQNNNNMPTRSEFNFAASANKRDAPPPVFDFNAVLRSAVDTDAEAQSGGGGFVLEPQRNSFSGGDGGGSSNPFAAAAPQAQQPPTPLQQQTAAFNSNRSNPYANFGSSNNDAATAGSNNNHNMFSSPSAAAAAPAVAAAPPTVVKPNDPYYDDIDDYTVPPETVEPPTVEFDSNFNFGVEEPTPAAGRGGASGAAAASSGPPPRPTFNFGPSDDTAGGGGGEANRFGGGGAADFNKPEFDFGGGGDATSGGGGFTSGLPTYSFGS